MMMMKCSEYNCCEKVEVVCDHWYYGRRRYEYYIEYFGDEELEEILHQIRKDLKEWEKVTFIFSYVVDGKGYEIKRCID